MAMTVNGIVTGTTHAFINSTSTLVNGPWQSAASSTVTDLATLTTGVNVLGFLDGSNRAKYFYSSYNAGTNSTVLPVLAAPNAVPNGAWPLGATGTGLAYVVVGGTAANSPVGMIYFAVTPAAGSPDTGSPVQYSLDPYGLLLVDSVTAEWV